MSAPGLVSISTQSAKRLRTHVERFARYFLREMHAGGMMFEAVESEKSVGFIPYKAFLFVYQGHYVGASCFRYRDDQDKETPWLFTWLWIHPFVRRRGVLTQTWTELNAQVGNFRLAPPVSLHMQTFLRKAEAWDHGSQCYSRR